MVRFLTFVSALLWGLAGAAPAWAQLSIDYAETVDVTTSGFSVVWESSGPAAPAITIYADAAGTVDITDQFEVTLYPFQGGDPDAADEIAQADALDALIQAMSDRGLARVRVHGGQPDTTYYYSLESSTPTETAVFPAGAPVPVTTVSENSFITQSNQILVSVLFPDPTGALMTVNSAETLNGLSAVVGDGAVPNQAFGNLSQLFQAAGQNWDPTGSKTLSLSLRFGGGKTETQDFTVDFVAGFAVASTQLLDFGPSAVLITVLEPSVDRYTTGETIGIAWEDDFPGPGAQVSLFYDTDNAGEDGTLIVAGLNEAADGAGDTFDWTPTGIPDGSYFVYAVVSDGVTSATSYSPGQVTIDQLGASGDGDALSDLWELFFFGDLARDGTGDFDNDGSRDQAEFDNDTKPDVPDILLVLRDGLNIVSLPIDPSPGLDSAGLLQRIGAAALSISRVVNNQLVTTRQVGGLIQGTTFPLQAGEGYHLELAGDFEDRLEGLAVAGGRDLTPGVNLIGFPSVPDGLTASALLQAIGDSSAVASVRRYNRANGRVETMTYVDLAPAGVDFPIERGRGYIVDMKGTVAGFEP